MERRTTKEHYMQSVHEVIAANAVWMKTEYNTPERAEALLAYERAMGFAQMRATRLGYHESKLYVDALEIRKAQDV